ncbi:hypothetical protein ACFOY4_30900 [Actinomadura syzygii]|uniref:Uncharacterized protein n=1 Tax=Actinomadura syzygii TaxID=1427538 RepID=A0A5D0TV42_9ACTN|nr:hypothetical protein [Actinomadura syzygii]TYC08729.1 hypothetical protein FXF65_38300 [Actinomadura syzygii]
MRLPTLHEWMDGPGRVNLADIGLLPDTQAYLERHQREVREFIAAAGLEVSEQSLTLYLHAHARTLNALSNAGLDPERSYRGPGDPLDWFTTRSAAVLAVAVEEGILAAA